MTVQRRKDDKSPRVIMHKIADVRGGVSVYASELGGDFLPEGAVLSAPDDKGICHVVKTAVLYAATSASDKTLKVKKGHNFVKGDVVTADKGSAASTISSIDSTTSKEYDSITLGAALGVLAKGSAVTEATKATTSTDSTLKYTPFAINGTGKPVFADSNINTDAWVIAVTKGNELPASIAEQLKGIINY